MSGKRWIKYLVKELSQTENGLAGLYQVNGQYRSESLDLKQVA
jgi:hypothetical protein